jgi:hypothetical protein
MYMAGYVIECLLKALVLKRRRLKRLPSAFRAHDLGLLAAEAGISESLRLDSDRAPLIALELIAREWRVMIRYEGRRPRPEEAGRVLQAVEVLRRWLRSRI